MLPNPAGSVGPLNPKSSHSVTGTVEETFIDAHSFHQQYTNYQRDGFALDSVTGAVIGSVEGYNEHNKRKITKADKKRKQAEMILNDDSGDESGGPWATFKRPNEKSAAELLQMKLSGGGDKKVAVEETPVVDPKLHIQEPDREAEMWEKVNERKISHILPPRPERGSTVFEAKSTFHGAEQFDYQGRSWVTCPPRLKPDDGEHECFIPKKCTKKLTGHTKGVQAIEYYPRTGHLLLSASMDGKCKIWDAHSDYGVRRTYIGHEEAVRSINMSNTGDKFLSSGFDRYIRLWDVETGQATGTFSNRKMGYQVKFYPKDNNMFIVACSDNKIYQWDCRTGEVCQEYNYHLQPCNSVLFFDGGSKFVSTSDDKKVLVWEFGIPVPLKYIAEPDMHTIPTTTIHPSGTHFAGQSMDNKICVFTCGEKVKPLRKKVFTGFNNSGYACQIGFSPNGQFIMSGDGHGQLNFWDWQTQKPYRKFQAHDNGPCMGAQWHPIFPSVVATCGWDGLIKIWE